MSWYSTDTEGADYEIVLWLVSWEKGPYLLTSQFSERDVKVCEIEASKSQYIKTEVI